MTLVQQPEPVTEIEASAESRPVELREWLREPIDRTAAFVVAGAWLVLSQIAFALEPATSRSEPAIGVLLGVAMYGLLATMIAGLVMHRRFGVVASLGAAVLATAASIACPLTGHHQFGTWWFGQMACVLALVGISAAMLRRPAVTT